ncbi:lytic transglycosylase domain-containing protein [Alkaliphilus pronyensis]|uniref:Lytic transglycosylase domain-containing protein n=1 Tax=Alkaliphilus pronyensis TaxID=1482732 RepID=A0A6I0EYD9_9FIRM|nr:lytic transglycosylase domain-containing protein [Alkaliphilus pronyensis]KAB3529984.1 lytic transglycosylase domain-containing protein [Alkaliphilus pronyensis]
MKKLPWILLLIVALLGVLLFREEGPANNQQKIDNLRADPYLNNVTGPIEQLELLQLLKDDNSLASQETLKELAQQVNATGYMANLILAEKLEENGEDPIEYYRKALKLYESPETQLKLARALENRQEIDEAIKIYMAVIYDDEAINALQELGVNYSTIISRLIEDKQYSLAKEYIDKGILEAKDDEIKSLNIQHSLLYAKTEEYHKAIPLMESIIDGGYHDSNFLWWYGRSLEGVGEKGRAIEVYKDLDKLGAYRLGLLYEEKGNVKEAAKAYINSNAHISLWKGARILDDLSMEQEALQVYRQLAKETGVYQEDAAYRGYILHKKYYQSTDEELTKILEKSPAWMTAIGKEFIWQIDKEMTAILPDFINRVDLYEAAGEHKMADIERSIGEKHTSTEEKLGLSEWYQQQGNYFMSVRWGIRALKEATSLKAYQLAYQKPYEEEVLAVAEKYHIDPYLIWAVMREESHYNKDAMSRAGALGLMQIMPTTGQDIANRLKVNYSDTDMLIPEKNIEFGGFYISLMLKMFDGDLDKALAAYNGGLGNVRKWSRTSIGGTPEGFPTSINFRETRKYITKVKNSYYTYLWIYQ